MSTELVKQTPQSEKLDMAKLFVESKMFDGITQVAAAFVKIQAGAEIGLPAFASMSGIHIIKGKVSIGAGLMAGCVKGSGKYDYIVKKMEPTICSIDFLQAGKLIGNSTFTIDEARKAGTQNLDKFPRNMLFARAMSNGVKWYCPDVFTMPVYTPEELGNPEFTEDITHTEATQENAAVAATPITKKKLSLANYNTALTKLENGTGTAQALKDAFDLTELQITGIEAAAKKGEELKSAIESLPIATTPDELNQLKDQLPVYIVENASFVTAAGERLTVIMAAQA